MHPLINIANRAARSAGQIILHSMERIDLVQITEKGRNDFVTEVDKQVERAIIDVIHEMYPQHAILGEESGKIGNDETVWIIDPIDGTTNFIHNFPHFCISIAVQHKGRIEHGLIFDPVRQETFTASRGQGARLNDKRIRVNSRTNLNGALLGTGFPFSQMSSIESYFPTLKAFMPLVAGIRRAGSAALDLAYVAAGRLDGFWEFGLSPWDIAAGVILVQEAGGLVSDREGGEKYLENGSVVAANPKVLKQMLQVLKTSDN